MPHQCGKGSEGIIKAYDAVKELKKKRKDYKGRVMSNNCKFCDQLFNEHDRPKTTLGKDGKWSNDFCEVIYLKKIISDMLDCEECVDGKLFDAEYGMKTFKGKCKCHINAEIAR